MVIPLLNRSGEHNMMSTKNENHHHLFRLTNVFSGAIQAIKVIQITHSTEEVVGASMPVGNHDSTFQDIAFNFITLYYWASPPNGRFHDRLVDL